MVVLSCSGTGAGTYTKLDASVTAGGGVGALHLKNENGVVMKLTSRTQGLQRDFAAAHQTLDAVQSELTDDLCRARVRYLLERGRVFNSSGRPEEGPSHMNCMEEACID